MLNRCYKAAFYYLFLFCLALGITLNSITVGAVAPVAQNLSNVSSDATWDISVIVQQGRRFYEVGQFSAAIERWQEAENNFSDRGDKLSQAMTLNYLSLGYQQLGQWDEAKTAVEESQELLSGIERIEYSLEALNIKAQSLNARGSWEFAQGQHQAALDTWRQATKIYESIEDEAGKIGGLINEIQALQALGLYGQAEKTSQKIQDILEEQEEQPDPIIKAIGWRSLGNLQRRMGKVDESIDSLDKSLARFKEMERRSPQEISMTLLSLGDTYRLKESDKTEDNNKSARNEALECYRQAAKEESISPATRIKAQLNELNLLLELSEFEDAKNLSVRIQSQLDNLEPSRTSVYAYIDLADSLGKLDEAKNANSSIEQRADMIAKAVQQAEELEDKRAESFARGKLGQLYEENQQWDDALSLTTQALKQAKAILAKDIAYQWLWQRGRIYQEQDKRKEAIAAYKEAVNILQSIRGELVAMNRDTQFDFREQVEPVYREYVNLLIEEVEFNKSKQAKSEADNSFLEDARNTIDLLQLAELDNFFRDACLDVEEKDIEEIIGQDENRKTAFVYTIVLPKKLAVILSLPGHEQKPLLHTNYLEEDIKSKVDELLYLLSRDIKITEKQRLSKEFYDWIIHPWEDKLSRNGIDTIDTIAFVLDSSLQSIPMAALYDGNQYLVEKYAIALTPSLQLVDPKPLPTKLKVFIGGLNKADNPLPQVEQEIEFITNIVDTTKPLLNQDFTKTAIEEAIKYASVNVIHLATHGTFSSKAEQTYIVTFPESDDKDDRITINKLGEYINSRDTYKLPPIELLVLSACKTAAGDERAALGLAGFAVRSGARSTLASL